MKKQVYDLPLQSGPHLQKKRDQFKSVYQLVSEMPEDENECQKNQFMGERCQGDDRYNLPRQRQNGKQYIQDELYENRGINIQNLRERVSIHKKSGGSNQNNTTHSRYEDKNQKQETSHFIYLQTNNTYSNHSDVAKNKVESIYEKLLTEERAKKEKEKFILAQTTFKPKNLQKQIHQIFTHKERESSLGQDTLRQKSELKRTNSQKIYKTNTCNTLSEKQKQKQKQRRSNIHKRLEFCGQSKTKYEKILQQHFQSKPSSKKGDQEFNSIGIKNNSRNEVRFSKNKQLLIKNTIPNEDILNLKQKIKKIQWNLQNSKQKKVIDHKVSERALKFKTDAAQPKRQETGEKRKPVEWLQLDFYQRQEQIIMNRKEKEEKGKQKKTQQVINPSPSENGPSSKPFMRQSSSTPKLRQQKSTYLEQYYEKLQRRY